MGRAEELFERIVSDGEGAIDELIITRRTEELFLDFKTSANNGEDKKLHPNDRNTFAEAISGFGNSEGGVIVWGVRCAEDGRGSDTPSEKRPIVDTQRFVGWLERAISGCTVPPHSGVRNQAVGNCVVTLIPKSNQAPHQVAGKNQYYIRAGSSFVPAPHSVLAGMFGRRPQPHVFHMFTIWPAKFGDGTITAALGMQIVNDGPGIAEDLYLNVMMLSSPGDKTKISLEPKGATGTWSATNVFDAGINMIANVGIRLAPEARLQPLVIHISMAPPFTDELRIQGMCGAANSPPYRFELTNTANNLSELHALYDKRHAATGGQLDIKERSNVVARIFNIKERE